MTVLGKKGLSGWIEIGLNGLIALAAVLTVSLPWSIPAITLEQPGQADGWYEKYLLVLAVSGLLAVMILWQARGVMRNINRGQGFSENTVHRLRVMGIECLVLAGFYFLSVFLVTRFFMVAVFVTFSVVGFVLLVLAELFRQGITYKRENDKTI